MKLLPKSEITKAKSDDRKFEIDEGLKLARKVDLLRQTASEEESRLSKFRLETLKSVKLEMDKLQSDKDALNNVISSLEERKRELLVPLDAEWRKISDKTLEINRFENVLDTKSSILRKKEKELEQRFKEVVLEEDRIRNKGELIVKNHLEVEENKQKSEDLIKQIQEKKTKFDKYFEEKKQELLEREGRIASRERELSIEKEHIEKDKKSIIRTKRQLEDQRGTLERAFKRIKK